MTQTTMPIDQTFTMPPRQTIGFIRHMARHPNGVETVPTSYVRQLNQCYAAGWVRDERGETLRIVLTERGKKVARWIEQQDHKVKA